MSQDDSPHVRSNVIHNYNVNICHSCFLSNSYNMVVNTQISKINRPKMNADLMDMERHRIDDIKILMKTQEVRCPIRRYFLENEMRKLARRHYRIRKAAIPSPATLLRYRGTTFFFDNQSGDSCQICVNHDNSIVEHFNRSIGHSILPKKGVRKWLEYSMYHMYSTEVYERTEEEQYTFDMLHDEEALLITSGIEPCKKLFSLFSLLFFGQPWYIILYVRPSSNS